jgi:hypothetical protein
MREKKIPERQTSLHCAECLCGRYFESEATAKATAPACQPIEKAE